MGLFEKLSRRLKSSLDDGKKPPEQEDLRSKVNEVTRSPSDAFAEADQLLDTRVRNNSLLSIAERSKIGDVFLRYLSLRLRQWNEGHPGSQITQQEQVVLLKRFTQQEKDRVLLDHDETNLMRRLLGFDPSVSTSAATEASLELEKVQDRKIADMIDQYRKDQIKEKLSE